MSEHRTRRDREVGILRPEEAHQALLAAGPARAALALLLFAGIRPGELGGDGKPPLLWSAVDPEAKIIRIPAANAKTRRARILEDLPPSLWRFLVPPTDRHLPVSPSRPLQIIRRAQIALGYTTPRGHRLKPWPHDGTRHSFATYHLARYADPGKTSLLLGHEGNPSLLYRHYRGLATRAEALEYFDPPTEPPQGSNG